MPESIQQNRVLKILINILKNYYSILEISSSSTESDIRKAYRKLAKKYHPDINKSKNAHEKFISNSRNKPSVKFNKISDAFKLL